MRATMEAAKAEEIVKAFLYANPIPLCDAAVTDGATMLGLEWTFPDGRSLWIDIDENGTVDVIWKAAVKK